VAETENISKMADKISKDIFGVFGWERVGPKNVNWKCVYPQEHSKSTHPSDVVFTYRDPYRNTNVYINCDLKSYAKSSINKLNIAGAIKSLCSTIECAQVSPEWQDLYLQKGSTPDISGMLFVYNHDGGYDKEFKNYLQLIDDSNFKIGSGCKVFVVEPFDVLYLNIIANDILKMRGTKDLPDIENCTFYYPDLFRKKKNDLTTNSPATVEMLLGPWQILKYKINGVTGIIFYVKTHGETVEEFLYLIDYLIHYQVISFCDEILIKLPFENKLAASNFEKSINEYSRQQSNAKEEIEKFAERLKAKIKYESVTNIVSVFSEIAIGMEG